MNVYNYRTLTSLDLHDSGLLYKWYEANFITREGGLINHGHMTLARGLVDLAIRHSCREHGGGVSSTFSHKIATKKYPTFKHTTIRFSKNTLECTKDTTNIRKLSRTSPPLFYSSLSKSRRPYTPIMSAIKGSAFSVWCCLTANCSWGNGHHPREMLIISISACVSIILSSGHNR